MIKWDDGKLFFHLRSWIRPRAAGLSSKWKQCSYSTRRFFAASWVAMETSMLYLLGYSPNSGKYQVYGDPCYMPWFLSIHTNLCKTWPTTHSTKTSVKPFNASQHPAKHRIDVVHLFEIQLAEQWDVPSSNQSLTINGNGRTNKNHHRKIAIFYYWNHHLQVRPRSQILIYI